MSRRSQLERADIVAAARSRLGAPFRHQGRGAQIDCVGLLASVATQLDIEFEDYRAYPRLPNGQIVPLLQKAGMLLTSERRIGNVAVFRLGKLEWHVAVLSDVGLIHTHAVVRRVVETALDAPWERRLTRFLQFPGVV